MIQGYSGLRGSKRIEVRKHRCNVVLADKVYCSDIKYTVALSGQTHCNLKTPTSKQKHAAKAHKT